MDGERMAEEKLDLDEYIKDLSGRIDDRIDGIIEKYDLPEFLSPIKYAMTGKTGGKKIRPALATLMCQALGGKDDTNTLEVSVIVEFLHQGSIVLDDMIDGDKNRRGQPSMWLVENLGKSSVIGLIMFMAGNKIGTQRVPRVQPMVMETVEMMAKGNQIDMDGFGMDEKRYMDMIYKKTAYLYGAAAKFGSVMADATDEVLDKAFNYGRSVGMMFQLTDDLVDILKTKRTGFPVGDMRRGKVTLVMIDMFNKDKDSQKFLERYARREMIPEELTAFFQMEEKTASIKLVEERINAYISASKDIVQNFPKNKYTDALFRLPEYMRDSLMMEV